MKGRTRCFHAENTLGRPSSTKSYVKDEDGSPRYIHNANHYFSASKIAWRSFNFCRAFLQYIKYLDK